MVVLISSLAFGLFIIAVLIDGPNKDREEDAVFDVTLPSGKYSVSGRDLFNIALGSMLTLIHDSWARCLATGSCLLAGCGSFKDAHGCIERVRRGLGRASRFLLLYHDADYDVCR